MKKVIQWKQGYRAKISAEKSHVELEQIRKVHGSLTAANVLERASSPKSAMHNQFDWDDSHAGHQWRLEQARRLIRSMEFISLESPKKTYKEYSIVSLPPDVDEKAPRRVYQSTEEALQDPVMRDEILGNAIRDAISFRRKYAALQELSQVFKALDSLLENFG